MIQLIHQATGCSVRRICDTLELPRSSYYHAATPTATERSDQQIGPVVEKIFKHHRRRYGYRRIHEDLVEQGVVCGSERVLRIMRERDLRAIQPKKHQPRTSDGRADCPSLNLIVDQPPPQQPNEVWAGDITFIPTVNGWLYLAIVIDLCSRKIIGWSLANHMRSELVVGALHQALGSRKPPPGLIFHSDRGSQYGSKVFRQMLDTAKIRQSMSARANPYHNAFTESCIGTLKAEMLQDGTFLNETDARTELFSLIESYYNTKRKHSSLEYQSPMAFEAKLLSLN